MGVGILRPKNAKIYRQKSKFSAPAAPMVAYSWVSCQHHMWPRGLGSNGFGTIHYNICRAVVYWTVEPPIEIKYDSPSLPGEGNF